jgi:hypothetical protein|tara:strand:- start:1690 stop:1956 length:267 start_codon:yes stop_codon:yes gene_type:complete
MAPTGIRLIELSQNHEHSSCTENSIHFHQKHDTCVSCDFSFSNFELKTVNKSYVLKEFMYNRDQLLHNEILFVTNILSFDLRGPPFNV